MALDREQDWQLFFESSSVRAHKERLESIITPPLFNKSIIRILVRSASAGKNWLWSGNLIQEIGHDMEFQRWKIPLDRKNIIQVPLSGKYRLRFESTKWLNDLYIKIDTYEGMENA